MTFKPNNHCLFVHKIREPNQNEKQMLARTNNSFYACNLKIEEKIKKEMKREEKK